MNVVNIVVYLLIALPVLAVVGGARLRDSHPAPEMSSPAVRLASCMP